MMLTTCFSTHSPNLDHVMRSIILPSSVRKIAKLEKKCKILHSTSCMEKLKTHGVFSSSTLFQFRSIQCRARRHCMIRQVIYELISSLKTGMKHFLLQPDQPSSNFLLWFQLAICQLVIARTVKYW
jgi:hypothetical protein